MKKLELLGLQADGESLTLNDTEGNRYQLAITDELRAALRKDKPVNIYESDTSAPITPREIQALVREGKTVEEISELSSLPLSRVEALAHPILNERIYTARLACSFPTARERGAMSLEELVVTRLATRDVDSDTISWDAMRHTGHPWTLVARYVVAGRECKASWAVNLQSHTFHALDDEAVWLSETPLMSPHDTWRPANTPTIVSAPSAHSAPGASRMSGQPTPPTHIDSMLATLNSQRGTSSAMPTVEAEDDNDTPDNTGVATIVTLPSRPHSGLSDVDTHEPEQETIFDLPVSLHAPQENSPTDDTTVNTEEEQTTQQAPKKMKKTSRASVPTWDEIVFGKKSQ